MDTSMDTLVIVTGGSSGLGRALLDTAPTDSTRVDISRSGHPDGDVTHLRADLADPAAWSGVGARIADLVVSRAWERITFIHSAGTLDPIGFVGETDADAVTANVLLNSASGQVLGHRYLAAVRELDVRRELVMISSGAAGKAVPGWSTYSAAKAAFDAWVAGVGVEQQQRGGVRILAVAPGVVATPMQETIRDTDEHDFPGVQRFRDLHDDGQLIDPVVAAGNLWTLLDDDSVSNGSRVDLRER